MRPASVGFQCPDCVKEGARSIRPVQAAFGGRAVRDPRLTQVLIGINVVLFLITIAGGSSLLLGGTPSRLFQDLAETPTLHPVFSGGEFVKYDNGIAQGQYYRMLTAMFLHFGIIHLALNMAALYQLGPALEAAFGRVRFGALYLLSGLTGSAASYAFGSTNSLGAGASGAIFGLFAAFYLLQRRRGLDVSAIGSTIVLNVVISFAASQYIDYRAHLGGLVGGGALTLAIVHAPQGKHRWVYQAVGALGLAVIVVAVVAVRSRYLLDHCSVPVSPCRAG